MKENEFDLVLETGYISNEGDKKQIKAMINYTDNITREDLAIFFLDKIFQTLAPVTDKDNEYENTVKTINIIEEYLKEMKETWEV